MFSATDFDSFDPQIIAAYTHGHRVKVRSESNFGWTRTGRVSRSMGPVKVYLLIHRRNQIGSWDVLDSGDRVVAVQWNDHDYTPV